MITRWHPHFPDTTEQEIPAHFLYYLGAPMTPNHPVSTGNIYATGRVWAAINLLLTYTTIAAAIDETQRRK
ncbi:hypothetical protein MKK88_02175 [Methylobacterium sp. E-005]|uniref:hypothetical protein n=1 Tax=Methylobacterium sp. E-005 TaxID=2836549 RepID=UPI001FBBA35C|nr:hypothetical protein [Methylobacterium sp. E-005]MCJ2084802.1 hypothetical protein [Methylobacterium sp. E-005]